MPYSVLDNAVLSEKIDWIAYSQAFSLEWDFPSYIDDHWKDISAGRFYTNGQENKQGVKRFWNIENLKQGKSVVLSGVASDILRDHQLDYLQWVNTSDRKATRIDFALDILHSNLTVKLVRKHLLNGEARTHAKSRLEIGEVGTDAYTQYVGTKSAETYTRIYNKAYEQQVNYRWTRIETVYQGSRARPALKAYCEGQSTRALIRKHVDFRSWSDWRKLMSSDVVKFDMPAHTTATRAWLLSQVAKAMARELARDEEHSFWFEFRDKVDTELRRLEENRSIIDF
jgi:hypothetical protein